MRRCMVVVSEGRGGGWAMIAEPTTTCCCVRCVSMCVCVCTRLYGGCLSFFSSQRDCHEGQTHHTNTNTHPRTHARGREGREGGREGEGMAGWLRLKDTPMMCPKRELSMSCLLRPPPPLLSVCLSVCLFVVRLFVSVHECE